MKIIRIIDKIISLFLILSIKFYQKFLSPILGSNCRHTPTCSNYSIEAIKVYGFLKGSWMALKRITRCHQFGTYGYDPVPPKIKVKSLEECLQH